MSDLPRSTLSRMPLFVLSVALAVGLWCARIPVAQSGRVLLLGATFSVGLSLVSVLFLHQRKSFTATVCLVTAFVLTGLSLGIADTNVRPRDRLSHFY